MIPVFIGIVFVGNLLPDVPRIEVVVMYNALEIRCAIWIALPYIFATFRVRAQRSLELHSVGR